MTPDRADGRRGTHFGMCGIAGIVGRLNERNRDALRRMSAAMVHRGPDAEGSWESPPGDDGCGVLLAHRRLAILDLSPTGVQPMVDEVTGDVIVFNGEIYNFQELRRRLAAAGHSFRSTGDTAVLLRALGVEGEGAVRSARGMFAFAFWARATRRLLLARDPLGMKPLYLATCPDPASEWKVAFASEIRALLASGLLGQPRLDPRAAASVVWNGFVVGPQTAVRGVEMLLPGELRTFDGSGTPQSASRYWAIPAHRPEERIDEQHLGEILQDCVRAHLISDVPLGVFLSGGIDSSAVANLAQQVSQGGVHTFTLAFEEQQYNEGPAAAGIARAIGTRHQEVTLTGAQFASRLEQALDTLDQPSFDGLNSYYMSHAVRQAGFTVALVGTGGDELFGGYSSFRDLPVARRWLTRLRWIPRAALVSAARLIAGRTLPPGAVAPQTRWAKLPEMVRRGDDLIAMYQLAYALFLPEFQRELLDGQADTLEDGLPAEVRALLAEEIGDRSTLSALSVLEQRLFLGERLLRDNDVASMAASIEQRLPFVDQVLFENVDRLPDEVRYAPVGRKALLRRIGLRGLDPALFERPKRGFELPYDRWIRTTLKEDLDATLLDDAAVAAVGLAPSSVARLWKAFLEEAPGIHWSRPWALHVLVHWCHRHRVLA